MSKRLLAVIVMVFAITTVAFGQGGAVKSTTQSQSAGKSGPLPSGKVAIIDSRAFGEGIGEMKKQLDKLEVEFQPRYKELEGLQNDLLRMDDELKKMASDPKA